MHAPIPQQVMFTKAGVKGQGVGFLFTDSQIVQERFLVRMWASLAIAMESFARGYFLQLQHLTKYR